MLRASEKSRVAAVSDFFHRVGMLPLKNAAATEADPKGAQTSAKESSKTLLMLLLLPAPLLTPLLLLLPVQLLLPPL